MGVLGGSAFSLSSIFFFFFFFSVYCPPDRGFADMCRSPQQVSTRIDALIAEIKEKVMNTAASWPGGSIVAHATGEARDIVCIGHGHILSAMALRWTGQSLANGLRLLLEPSSVAVLGYIPCSRYGVSES